jgi:HD-GYP domain-containing protein (c-di-GMP phosphodiesterase class II)
MLKNIFPVELNQRKRTLSIILWIVLLASFSIGIENLQYRTWNSIIALFALSFVCIPLLILNSRGYYFIAALLLSILVLNAINFNLYDGDGILDSGIIAYPILIMVGTLFFGKKASPYFAIASIVSVAAIDYFQIQGVIQPTINPPTYISLIPITILLVVSSVIVWVIVDNMEKNLMQVKESEFELMRNYDMTLEAWSKVLEYRDRETQDHSRRLVELSTKLARAAGCSEEQIINLRRGALMHDIGKLAIPNEVLLKPDLLNEEEKKIIEKHPVYAKQMLSSLPFLGPAISVAYSHHERWDGQGYPERLQGEAIPLLARIFAVVDTWDALNSERIYRPAWPKDKIIAYLKENAGIRFDPRLVQVFLGVIETTKPVIQA